jgi:hypothetical protein
MRSPAAPGDPLAARPTNWHVSHADTADVYRSVELGGGGGKRLLMMDWRAGESDC